MLLVGLIIRIYHDAQLLECQICQYLFNNPNFTPYIIGMEWVIRHIIIFNVLMNILKTEVH